MSTVSSLEAMFHVLFFWLIRLKALLERDIRTWILRLVNFTRYLNFYHKTEFLSVPKNCSEIMDDFSKTRLTREEFWWGSTFFPIHALFGLLFFRQVLNVATCKRLRVRRNCFSITTDWTFSFRWPWRVELRALSQFVKTLTLIYTLPDLDKAQEQQEDSLPNVYYIPVSQFLFLSSLGAGHVKLKKTTTHNLIVTFCLHSPSRQVLKFYRAETHLHTTDSTR